MTEPVPESEFKYDDKIHCNLCRKRPREMRRDRLELILSVRCRQCKDKRNEAARERRRQKKLEEKIESEARPATNSTLKNVIDLSKDIAISMDMEPEPEPEPENEHHIIKIGTVAGTLTSPILKSDELLLSAMAKKTNATECCQCHRPFNSDRRIPREFPCNHTVCTLCILDMIEFTPDQIMCPTCCCPGGSNKIEDYKIALALTSTMLTNKKHKLSDQDLTLSDSNVAKIPKLSHVETKQVSSRPFSSNTTNTNYASINMNTNADRPHIQFNLEQLQVIFTLQTKAGVVDIIPILLAMTSQHAANELLVAMKKIHLPLFANPTQTSHPLQPTQSLTQPNQLDLQSQSSLLNMLSLYIASSTPSAPSISLSLPQSLLAFTSESASGTGSTSAPISTSAATYSFQSPRAPQSLPIVSQSSLPFVFHGSSPLASTSTSVPIGHKFVKKTIITPVTKKSKEERELEKQKLKDQKEREKQEKKEQAQLKKIEEKEQKKRERDEEKEKRKQEKKPRAKKHNNSPPLTKQTFRWSPHNPIKFDILDPTEIKAAIQHLDEFGYVVLKNAADEKQIERLTSLFWDYHEELNRHIKRDAPFSWNNKQWPGIFSYGMEKYYGIGTSPFMDECRTLPTIRKFFEEFYKTDNLLVSLDGCGVVRGGEHQFDAETGWLHVDQNKSFLTNHSSFFFLCHACMR